MIKLFWFAFVFRLFTTRVQNILHESSNAFESKKDSSLSTTIDFNGVKQRMDTYLTSQHSKFSRAYIADLINNGNVLVNGTVKQVKGYRLKLGDVVKIVPKAFNSTRSTGTNITLDIIHEDDHMMILNKAAGMVVHPGAGMPDSTVSNAIEYYIKNKANSTSITSLDNGDETTFLDNLLPTESFGNHIVHRLDKGSSGVLLVGKNRRMTKQLSEQFSSRDVVKYYLAVCVGNPGITTISKSIGRSLSDRKKMTVRPTDGKPAVSHVISLLFDGQLSVAMIRIDTGRTHQIRVHMKERRTPLLGDEQYGSRHWNRQLVHGHRATQEERVGGATSRTLLHAYETQFTHPVSGERLSVRAPIPSDILTIVNRIAMKNIYDCNVLPLLHTTKESLKEASRLLKVIPNDVEQLTRGSTLMHSFSSRQLPDIVDKENGLLHGNTYPLYATLQRMSSDYQSTQDAKKVKQVRSVHGYVGRKGFFVAQEVSPSTKLAQGSAPKSVNKPNDDDDKEVQSKMNKLFNDEDNDEDDDADYEFNPEDFETDDAEWEADDVEDSDLNEEDIDDGYDDDEEVDFSAVKNWR